MRSRNEILEALAEASGKTESCILNNATALVQGLGDSLIADFSDDKPVPILVEK